MNIEFIEKKVKEMLPERRYKHSLNVANCAVKLSELYGYDKEKAYNPLSCKLLSCGMWDLNPHAIGHENLNLARLPIPTIPQAKLL